MAEPSQHAPGHDGKEMSTDKIRGIIIGVALALMGMAIAYGVGRLQGATATASVQEELKTAEEEQKREASMLQDRVSALQRRVELLEARRQLHLSLIALDARNFGTAQGHLEQAASQLSNAKQATPGLEEIVAGLGALRLVASEDVAGERARVLVQAAALDAAIERDRSTASPVP